MIKLSDYVVEFLVHAGIKDIFMVSGGGIMHLTDSVGRNKNIRYYCNYHEQASAIAAEAYARVKGQVGACLVTTGPGSTNALSGIAGAWVDSIPVIVISGQVRRNLIADYSKLRQLGPQEINIIDMAKPVTKYAKTIMEPQDIGYELEYAYRQAMAGRPGPVWINIPLDVQGCEIDETKIPSYQACPLISDDELRRQDENISKLLNFLQKSERPILVCGNGIHLAHAKDLLDEFVRRTGIPALFTFGGMDLLEEDHPNNVGRLGPVGQRRANFALQNSDLLISLGASLSVASIGFNAKGFAPKSKKIMVNIDPQEFLKPSVDIDLAVPIDAKLFLEKIMARLKEVELNISPRWKDVCATWKARYPIVTPDYFSDPDHVNSYVFVNILSEMLEASDVILWGNSLDSASMYQTFKIKKGQRAFTSINYGAMGWDLPAAVGACIANNSRRTILITGDGSFQFNIQELQTIRHNHLPIKIFILNNKGYDSIRSTQKNYFNGFFVGSDEQSGVGNPDYKKIAEAYDLSYDYITNNGEIKNKAKAMITDLKPSLCELNINYAQGRSPRISSFLREDGTLESRPLEDMFPFLPREEIWENMHLFDKTE